MSAILAPLREAVAEFLGTFILVFFGVGAVHVAVLTGALPGLWQVASVWGVGIALAIYATGSISGTHLNPAITVAFAAFRKFPLRKVGPYVFSQCAGAFVAAALLYALYSGSIARYEAANGLARGGPGRPAAQRSPPKTFHFAPFFRLTLQPQPVH